MLPDEPTQHDCPLCRMTDSDLLVFSALLKTLTDLMPVRASTIVLIVHQFFHAYDILKQNTEVVNAYREQFPEGICPDVVHALTQQLQAQQRKADPAPREALEKKGFRH